MDNNRILKTIKQVFKDGKWTSRKLAEETKLSEATIYRLLKKDNFSRNTLIKVCDVLNILTEEETLKSSESADIVFGGYPRENYKHYEAKYYCLRPSFSDNSKVNLYEFEVEWCGLKNALIFHDLNKGFEQIGEINLCPGTQFLHFMTHDKGSVRIITTYHMSDKEYIIRGMILTLSKHKRKGMHPVAAPIIFGKQEFFQGITNKLYGLLPKSHPSIQLLYKELEEMNAEPLFLGT